MVKTPDISKPKVITLGCRLNAYESDIMAGHASDNELGNTVIINSCAVTNKAVADSRAAVRKAKRDNPNARIIVTGCAAQLDPKGFADMGDQLPKPRRNLPAAGTACSRKAKAVRAPFCKCKMAATIAAPFVLSPLGAGRHALSLRAKLLAIFAR